MSISKFVRHPVLPVVNIPFSPIQYDGQFFSLTHKRTFAIQNLVKSNFLSFLPTFKKNPAAGKPVSYAQIDLKFHPRRKKLILTTKPALVIRKLIVCVNGCFNMLC